MELYHNDMSVCAQKVRLVLAEKGLNPILHHLNLRAGDAHRPEYLALNPAGVVPTLVDEGRPIVESTVICEYLEDTHPRPALRPANPYSRAQMRLWTMRPDAGLHRACGVTSFAIAFRHQAPDRQIASMRDPARQRHMRDLVEQGLDLPEAAEAVRKFASLITDMDAALAAHPWLGGETYSLADAAMLPYVLRLSQLQLEFLWDHKPVLAAWLERANGRENFHAIADHLDPAYLATMREYGTSQRAQVKALLAG